MEFLGCHSCTANFTHYLQDEGRDRENITLPGNQEALVQAVVATGTPVVVVLVHGGPLAIEWTRDHVSAIVSAHYPGELGGEVSQVTRLLECFPPSFHPADPGRQSLLSSSATSLPPGARRKRGTLQAS